VIKIFIFESRDSICWRSLLLYSLIRDSWTAENYGPYDFLGYHEFMFCFMGRRELLTLVVGCLIPWLGSWSITPPQTIVCMT
jgi:hypothetical protein